MNKGYPDIGHEVMPLLSGTVTSPAPRRHKANPAQLYLLSMRSEKSRRSLGSTLNTIAMLHGYQDYMTMNWSLLSRIGTLMLLEGLSLTHEELKTNPRFQLWDKHIKAIKKPGYKWKPKTTPGLRTYLTVIKGVAKELRYNGDIDKDAYEQIADIKIKGNKPAKARLEITPSIVTGMITDCILEDTAIGVRDAAMFSLLYGCGLRRDELRNLTIANIDWRGMSLYIHGKGDRHRIIPLRKEVAAPLQLWLTSGYRGLQDGYVLSPINKTGNIAYSQISESFIYKIVRTRFGAIGYLNTSPHNLRHLFGTSLLNAGVSINDVAYLMGHADLNTTRIYDRGEENRAKKVIQSLPGW